MKNVGLVAASVLFIGLGVGRARPRPTPEPPPTGGVTMATPHGPYARIAFLKPQDGNTVDFEAGYIRHLEWHRQAGDPWTWYGWTIWASGERQRWLVYATFGHAAGAFDAAVSPAEDERDNVANVVPHAEFAGSSLYEFREAISKGTGEPTTAPRAELTTVDLAPGTGEAFETALATVRSELHEEALWYRLIAGGPAPRYVRLRPRPSVASILDGASESALPADAARLIARATVEILNLRPTMSYGLPSTK
jgi:hypothetical protein